MVCLRVIGSRQGKEDRHYLFFSAEEEWFWSSKLTILLDVRGQFLSY